MKAHEGGYVRSTKNRLPLRLVHYEAFTSEIDAKRREKYLKGGNGKRELEIMLKEYFNKKPWKKVQVEDDQIIEEIEQNMLLLKICRERAEELVCDRGWNKESDDFDIQVEEEAKRQWDEEKEREMGKRLF